MSAPSVGVPNSDVEKSRSTAVWGELPAFVPHRLVPGGHAQTIVGAYWRGGERPQLADTHRYRRLQVDLPDGDRLIVHEDQRTDCDSTRTALLVHGLGGCHRSLYVSRLAHKLWDRGWRTLRMDMRGFGAGSLEARHHTHAGRWQDVASVIEATLVPQSSLAVVGFSMGANQLLKLLGCADAALIGKIERAIAVAPPLRLWECAATLDRGLNRIYDWSFVKTLKRQVQHRRQVPGFVEPKGHGQLPGSLRAFDSIWTAPLSGFRSIDEYYDLASAVHDLDRITVPTLIVSADDDPLLPQSMFADLKLPPHVKHIETRGGGHLGYIGRRSYDADARWLDWRIVEQLNAPLV